MQLYRITKPQEKQLSMCQTDVSFQLLFLTLDTPIDLLLVFSFYKVHMLQKRGDEAMGRDYELTFIWDRLLLHLS